MKHFNFIPYWYKEYEKDKKIKLVKSFIILFIMCDFLFAAAFVYFYNSYNSLISHIIPAFTYDVSLRNDEKKLFKMKSKKVMNSLNTFVICYRQNIVINEAHIKPEEVEISASVKSIDKYYDFINYIESSRGVCIKRLSAPSYEKKEITFNILLEAKS